jgi:hypothetical protein
MPWHSWIKIGVGLGNCRLGELVPEEIGECLNQRHSSPSPCITNLGFLPFVSATEQGDGLCVQGECGGDRGTKWG